MAVTGWELFRERFSGYEDYYVVDALLANALKSLYNGDIIDEGILL